MMARLAKRTARFGLVRHLDDCRQRLLLCRRSLLRRVYDGPPSKGCRTPALPWAAFGLSALVGPSNLEDDPTGTLHRSRPWGHVDAERCGLFKPRTALREE